MNKSFPVSYFVLFCVMAVASMARGQEPGGGERWIVPSWGDVVCLYGPGTDASMDSPEAMERTIRRWMARGMTGLTLRTDLADYEPMIHRNNSPQQNPRLQLLLDYVDVVSARFNVIETAEKIGRPLGFKVWAWHPHLYSDGAPADVGTPGLGRMIPWSYTSRYFLDHPEGVTIDRNGNKLWMVREYAYPEARATKVAEFVHMAREFGLKRFIACMRSEVNQLVDPPEKGDQYGFNQPVVEEMKQRHGVDILTDPRFDAFAADFRIDDPMVENWRRLRGEHITQFYRELRKGLDEVDPAIEIAVTLSGEYAGPPLGNQRLDWRTWVNEGLVDAIIVPVFFEATLDHEAERKGYLTHSRKGVGTVVLNEMRDYIRNSPHPGIAVITSGPQPYFDQPVPDGADGWRCDAWYELYTSAWYQRWSQWMKDVDELGAIRFIEQNFDDFPSDASRLPPAGSYGRVAYDPKIRACRGGWYPFGDEVSGKAFIQQKVRHGETGQAVRLESNGAQGPTLTGYHASDADRSNISAVLDTSITNGTCAYTFWILRESEQSGATAYLENRGGELDVGVQIEPLTGLVSYTTGRSPGGTGTWQPTDHRVAVGAWESFTLLVDFASETYAVRSGGEDGTLLADQISYSPPPPRTTMQNGVNQLIPVPTYKAFRQVLFAPLGPAGSRVYLDDVSVKWYPDPVFHPVGQVRLFREDFEALENGPELPPASWSVASDRERGVQVISSTSYRQGVKSLCLTGSVELKPLMPKALVWKKGDVLTCDLDLLIRSTASVASLIPGQQTASNNVVELILEPAESATEPRIRATAKRGEWTLEVGDQSLISTVAVPYDCWMQVQLAVDTVARTVSLVQQQIGQVPEWLGSLPLTGEFRPGMAYDFRVSIQAPENEVALDNLNLTRRDPEPPY